MTESTPADSLSHAQMLAYARELHDLYQNARAMAARFRHLVEIAEELADAPTLNALLQLALDRVIALTGHEGGTILLVAGPEGPLEPRATAGIDIAFPEPRRYSDLARRALQQRQPLSLANAGDGSRTLAPEREPHFVICLPLMPGGSRPIGVMALRATSHPVRLDGQEVDALQLLAGQLSSLIERVQLTERLQRHMEALLAVHQVTQIIGSTLEMDQVGRILLNVSGELFGLEGGSISLRDRHQRLRLWQTVGPEHLWSRAQHSSAARSARRSVLAEGEPRLYVAGRRTATAAVVAAWCLPLLVRERVIGIVELYGAEPTVRQAPLQVLTTLTGAAASALENARLYQELGRRESRLRDLIAQLLAAQEEERRRVASDLQDGLAQVAASVRQRLRTFLRHPASAPPRTRRDMEQALGAARRSAVDQVPRHAAPESPEPEAPPIERLTPRELQVLTLVARGHTNREIARALNIAPGTAKIHVERIIAKLGASDRTQAAVYAARLGIITPPPR